MSDRSAPPRFREHAVAIAAAIALTVVFTFPIAFKAGRVGRIDNGDGQLSIWNVAWVARTLPVHPGQVFDANVFYPQRGALLYSETNLGAGALAIPVYWATRNPYAAHNSVVLLAFALAFIGAYYLVRYLTGDWRAAAVAGVWFAFSPITFTRLAHIQLLMTAGLPLTMLAMHRVADRPTPGRGAALGAAVAGQALFCGYYGVFAILMLGYSTIVFAATRRLWRSASYWGALVLAACVSLVLVAPVLVPFAFFHETTGFRRSLGQAVRYSANWSAYLASPAFAHAWLLRQLPGWSDVLFPGFLATVFGIAGAFVAVRQRQRELVFLYGGIALLAFWLSLGPAAGLYSLLYETTPLFSFLRVPSRFGLIVVLALTVFGGIAVSALLRRTSRPAILFSVVMLCAGGELLSPVPVRDVPAIEPVYEKLSTLPPGPVIEMPYFYLDYMFPRNTYYMLQSTAHWMPLVNGYSDFMPPDFLANVMTLAPFPSRDSIKLLAARRVRYAVFHRHWYNHDNWRDVTARLKEFEPYLNRVYADHETRLYEIVGTPP